MNRLYRKKRLFFMVVCFVGLQANDFGKTLQGVHDSQENLLSNHAVSGYGGTYHILQEVDLEAQPRNSPLVLTYEDIDPEPNRCLQGVSTAVSWAIGILTLPISLASCCSCNPGEIIDQCNPLHERYVGPFKAESDDLCDQGHYMCCPCIYANQRYVYEESEDS